MKYKLKVKRTQSVRDSECRLVSLSGIKKIGERTNDYKDIYEALEKHLNILKEKDYELIDINICVKKKTYDQKNNSKEVLKFISYESCDFYDLEES